VDLPSIISVASPSTRSDLPPWQPGAAWLAGGTWLFSEPQPGLRTLTDLSALRWPALEGSEAGLRIGATCTIAALEAFEAPPEWRAGPLFAACCNALLGSFKVWNTATVGGNVCLSLPAAPMLALTVALDGVACIWRPAAARKPLGFAEPAPFANANSLRSQRDGTERLVPMADFTLGPQRTVLTPGELLRAIDLPVAALRRRAAWRQASLTTHGRSAALLVATLDANGGLALTVTASTMRPLHASWASPPSAAALDARLQAIPAALWYDDVHGAPAWRRHMTRRLAAELLAELTG
jgi:CO/xanthine dehydrogenase FAD-binding subunit